MKSAPTTWILQDLLVHCEDGPQSQVGGVWLPARPMGYYSLRSRLRIAWMVFTGRADALVWPEE